MWTSPHRLSHTREKHESGAQALIWRKPTDLTISVAMCTYQGSRHIRAQMESILAQTRLPNEVVVCDDGSSDGTVEILRSYSLTAPFAVRITENSHTLGVAQNFEKAVCLCSGDIVVLSDQDDVWREDKLARIEEMFLESPEIGGVFSDALVVDENLIPMGYTMWEHVHFTKEDQARVLRGDVLDILLRHHKVTGATLALRRSLSDVVLPIPPLWMHDTWIALLIAAVSKLSIIDETLVKYRQHSENQVGAKKKSIRFLLSQCGAIDRRQYYCDEISRYEAACFRIALKSAKGAESVDKIAKIRHKLDHLRARSKLPENRLFRLPMIFAGLAQLNYHRYSAGWQVAVKDLLLPPGTG